MMKMETEKRPNTEKRKKIIFRKGMKESSKKGVEATLKVKSKFKKTPEDDNIALLAKYANEYDNEENDSEVSEEQQELI